MKNRNSEMKTSKINFYEPWDKDEYEIVQSFIYVDVPIYDYQLNLMTEACKEDLNYKSLPFKLHHFWVSTDYYGSFIFNFAVNPSDAEKAKEWIDEYSYIGEETDTLIYDFHDLGHCEILDEGMLEAYLETEKKLGYEQSSFEELENICDLDEEDIKRILTSRKVKSVLKNENTGFKRINN